MCKGGERGGGEWGGCELGEGCVEKERGGRRKRGGEQ